MRVRVIGAGVAGLTTAIRLKQVGFDTDIWAAARTPNTTSDRAGAWFTPPRECASDAVQRWTIEGFRALAEIARENDPRSGVSMAPVREFIAVPARTASPRHPATTPHATNSASSLAPPWWHAPTACARPAADSPLPTGYAAVFAARTPRMEITRYVAFLVSRAITEGIRIAYRSISSFEEAFADDPALPGTPRVVVNATGLGARVLAPDPAVRAMRGQVLHVPNPDHWTEALIEEGRGSQGAYIFPYADHIVLGGTYEPDETEAVTDEPALQGILQRCAALAHAAGLDPEIVKNLGKNRLRAVAGLRPARILDGDAEAIRVEAETLPGANRTVIHNYGHGRSGISLSWGTAADVVALVRKLASA